MKRRVWSVDEIRDILVAANQASGASMAALQGDSAESVTVARAYRQGYVAALVTLSLALGLSPITGINLGAEVDNAVEIWEGM